MPCLFASRRQHYTLHRVSQRLHLRLGRHHRARQQDAVRRRDVHELRHERIHRALRRAHIVISGLSGPTSAALNCRLLPSRRIGLPMPAAVAIGDDHRSPCCSAPPRRQPFWSACRHRSCMQRICMTLDRIFRRPDRVFSPGVPDGWVPSAVQLCLGPLRPLASAVHASAGRRTARISLHQVGNLHDVASARLAPRPRPACTLRSSTSDRAVCWWRGSACTVLSTAACAVHRSTQRGHLAERLPTARTELLAQYICGRELCSCWQCGFLQRV
jgi:hypothetical protein